MLAMVLERQGEALRERLLPEPAPGRGEILLQVQACGVCRTDLHILDGELPHILAQVARHQGREVYAFTRPGDAEGQRFALELGAVWSGGVDQAPPVPLDAALLFAPAGEHVPLALRAVDRGGTVVCAGIHMSDIPSFPYELLWEERSLRSVANLTRRDGEEFLALAPAVPIRTEVTSFPLERANEALAALRAGRLRGAAVLAVAG